MGGAGTRVTKNLHSRARWFCSSFFSSLSYQINLTPSGKTSAVGVKCLSVNKRKQDLFIWFYFIYFAAIYWLCDIYVVDVTFSSIKLLFLPFMEGIFFSSSKSAYRRYKKILMGSKYSLQKDSIYRQIEDIFYKGTRKAGVNRLKHRDNNVT